MLSNNKNKRSTGWPHRRLGRRPAGRCRRRARRVARPLTHRCGSFNLMHLFNIFFTCRSLNLFIHVITTHTVHTIWLELKLNSSPAIGKILIYYLFLFFFNFFFFDFSYPSFYRYTSTK